MPTLTLGDWTVRTVEAGYLWLDGDPQMLVYDISRWAGPQTWLVACEIDDAGLRMGHGDGECDHDYSDVIFTVSGVAITPTLNSTFGKVKQRYH